MRIVWGLRKYFYFTKIHVLMHFKYTITKTCNSESEIYTAGESVRWSRDFHKFHILLLTGIIPCFNLHGNHPCEKITDNQ